MDEDESRIVLLKTPTTFQRNSNLFDRSNEFSKNVIIVIPNDRTMYELDTC